MILVCDKHVVFLNRLVLRCRQLARKRFAALREDVLAKIELLENKHVHDVVGQLHAIASQMASYNSEISRMMLGGGNDDSEPPLFPIEMDLTRNAFQYESVQPPINELYQEDQHCVRKYIYLFCYQLYYYIILRKLHKNYTHRTIDKVW